MSSWRYMTHRCKKVTMIVDDGGICMLFLLFGRCRYNCQHYSTSKGPVPTSYKKLAIWATFAPTPSQKTQSRSSPLRSNPNFECCERMLRGSPEYGSRHASKNGTRKKNNKNVVLLTN